MPLKNTTNRVLSIKVFSGGFCGYTDLHLSEKNEILKNGMYSTSISNFIESKQNFKIKFKSMIYTTSLEIKLKDQPLHFHMNLDHNMM